MGGWPGKTRAQAMVELALVLPVLLILVVGIIDFGRAFVVGVGVQQGAREAARFGANKASQSAITDTQIVQRLIDASMPALQGCTTSGIVPGATQSTVAGQACGYGTWDFTVRCSVPSGWTTNPPSCAARTSGAVLEVTASGSVPLLVGFLTGYVGITDIHIQGDASFVIL